MSDCDRLVDALSERAPLGGALAAHVGCCESCRLLTEAGIPYGDGDADVPPMSDALRAEVAAMQPVRGFSAWRAAVLPSTALLAVMAGSLVLLPRPAMEGLTAAKVAGGAVLALLVLAVALVALLRPGASGLGASPSARWRVVVAALAGIEAVNLWASTASPVSAHLEGAAAWHRGWSCGLTGTALSAVVGLTIFGAARRSAVVCPVSAGALAGLAAGCSGFALQHLACPVMDLGHTMTAHFAPMSVCALLGAVAGRRWLKV